MKIDLPEEKKVEEILSTEAERALKEKQRLEDEKEELTWCAPLPPALSSVMHLVKILARNSLGSSQTPPLGHAVGRSSFGSDRCSGE